MRRQRSCTRSTNKSADGTKFAKNLIKANNSYTTG